MEMFIEALEKTDALPLKIKAVCHENGLKLAFINSLTLKKLKKQYGSLVKNYYEDNLKNIHIRNDRWLKIEKNLYPFVLICLSFLKDKPLLNFGKEEYAELIEIFPKKSRNFLQYETMLLLDRKQLNKKKWTSQEQQIFASLVEKRMQSQEKNELSLKWKQISKELFIFSEYKYFRNPKICREKWYNHLDPRKKHGNWMPQEDTILIQFVINYGKKWSEIRKALENRRTEHMIKNRFKSLLLQHRKQANFPDIEQKILSSLARQLKIEKKVKEYPFRKKKIHLQNYSQVYQENHQNQNPQQEYQKVQVKHEQKLQQKPKEEQQQNKANFSPFCFVPTPGTLPISPFYFGSPLPFYGNTFGNGVNYWEYFTKQSANRE